MPSAGESYWASFSLRDKDVERLYGYVLERGEPIHTSELARVIIAARIKEEQERRARLSARAVLYQPKLSYQVGQRLIFSALGDAEGLVTAVRPSDNPRLPPFQVITVAFEGSAETREFAAAYDAPHPLNEIKPVIVDTTEESPEEIYARYGLWIERELTAHLRRDKDFVEEDGRWLLRGLMVDVHVGLLNIAEAAIEQNNTAMTTEELARVLELDGEGARRATVLFSLNYALQNDDRFVDVGPLGETRWYLERLIPDLVRTTPRILRMGEGGEGRGALPPELETLMNELEDESDEGPAPSSPRVVTLILTYPHRRAGTLPLTPAVRALFPQAQHPMMVTLVDEQGTRLPAWVVPDGHYIAGLKTWYDQHKLNPGAIVELVPREERLTATLRYYPQRERGLWVRSAKVQAGRLTFGTDRRPVAHKYDEEMLILIGDPTGLDNLAASSYGDRPLEMLLLDIFPELAKLVPGGRVHAKTIYSAVNFARRVGPRAVFRALAEGAGFSSVGGGYYVQSLVARPA